MAWLRAAELSKACRYGHSRRLVWMNRSACPRCLGLDAPWDAGDRNATDLWRRLVAQNFRGSLRVIGEWAPRRRRAEQAGIEAWQRVPSARTVARLLTTGRDHLTRAETVTVAAIEAGVRALAEGGEGVAPFQPMVRAMTLPWSNAQAKRQITKLKLVKRQIYRRGKIALLQARLIGPAP